MTKNVSRSGPKRSHFNISRLSCHAILTLILLCLITSIPIVNASSWISPTGFEDPDNDWSNEPKVYDENTDSWASSGYHKNQWGKFLVLTISEITSIKIRYHCWTLGVTQIDIDIYDGSWHHVYQGAIGSGMTWHEKSFDERAITKARVRFYHTNWFGEACMQKFNEFDFWEVEEEEEEYSFSFFETMNISSSLCLWKALMFSSTETVSISADSWFWKEKIVSLLESNSITDFLSVLKEKLLAFIEFFETVNPTSEAFFVFPSVNVSILFVGLMLILGVLAFVVYIAYKKKRG